MIWGMTLEPGKLYTEIMGEEVQLSMAAMDSRKDLDESSKSFCQIVMKTSKGEYVLCTLVHGVMFQQSLDLKLMPREKVTFSVQGPSVVYLVGYTASYPEDEEDLDLEDDDIEAAENSSAWESFDAEEESLMDQIKEEPLEILDDVVEAEAELSTDENIYKGGGVDGDDDEDDDEELPIIQHQPQPQQQQQQATTASEITETTQEEREEEIIFSVAELETSEMKTEPPPTPKPASPPPTSSQMQQMPPPQDVYSIQTTTAGTALGEPGPNSDFFYPESQQHPDVPITPPVSFQPSNSASNFQQNPQGLMPSTDTFIPPQKTYVQRALPVHQQQQQQHRQVIRGTVQQMNTQRTYPPQRRQYGTNRNQPAGKTRMAPQPVQHQQVRNISNIQQQQQQQSIPGTSQQDMPGPSTSGLGQTNYIRQPTTVSLMGGQPAATAPRPGRNQSASTISKVGRQRSSSPTPPVSSELVEANHCRYCGKKFFEIKKLREHESYHKRIGRFKCQYCDSPYHTMANVIRHEKTHTGEKPFKCRICGRGFTWFNTCINHEQTH